MMNKGGEGGSRVSGRLRELENWTVRQRHRGDEKGTRETGVGGSTHTDMKTHMWWIHSWRSFQESDAKD